MPRNDGTGPMGMGAMTGRGMGSCVELVTTENKNPVPGRGAGMGCGRRQRHGSGGRGLRWKRGWARAAFPEDTGSVQYAAPNTVPGEFEALRSQVKHLSDALTEISKRLSELDNRKE